MENNFTEKTIPHFQSKDINGREISILPSRDKFLLIDFSASWCKPCIEELPKLISLYNSSKKLTIISISLDRKIGDWKNIVERYNIKWENVCDGKGADNEIVQYFKVNSIPRYILISPEGLVVFDSIDAKSNLDFTSFLD